MKEREKVERVEWSQGGVDREWSGACLGEPSRSVVLEAIRIETAKVQSSESFIRRMM